jgi:hypothetical protein
MSQENAWILEEMARTVQVERRAAADRYRLATAVPGAYSSPRIVLAKALRSLASLLDGEAKAQPKPARRLSRAY